MDNLLKLLDTNARLTNAQLAVMLNLPEEDVAAQIAALERAGVVRAYKTLIDWDRTDREYVTAVIELRVTPRRDTGFETLAETVAGFEEVESVCLMSGGYDLSVLVSGRTFRDVADFVAKRLSTLDGVVSTGTHFVLRRYKERGVVFVGEERDERGVR